MEDIKEKDNIRYTNIEGYKINIYEPEYIKRIKNLYGFIYVTTNLINGKRYVGQTKRDKKGNWKYYLGSGTILKLAIEKYGKENFKKEIIDIAFNKKELNRLEKYYTILFNSVDNDNWYNIIYGGRNTNKDKLGKDNPSARAVICLNTNEVFDTEKQACEKYNLNRGALSETCNGKRYYCGKLNREKLAWMFLDEYTEKEAMERLILADSKPDRTGSNNPMYGKRGILHHSYGKILERMKGSKNPSARKIVCLTTNEVFDTATEGANKYNTDLSHIISCCKGKLRSSGKLEDGTKLQWAYYEDIINEENDIKNKNCLLN